MLPTLQLEEESLPILTVAEECSKEFPTTTRLDWLVSMAKAIYSDPPQLLLRPDELWNKKKQSGRRVISAGINLDGLNSSFFQTQSAKQATRRHKELIKKMQQPVQEPEVIEYDKHLSKLKELTKLKSTKEPPWVSQPEALKEKIHRDDFRTWCLAYGYNLPRFWFPKEENKTPAEETVALKVKFRERASNYVAASHKKGSKEIILELIDRYGYELADIFDILAENRRIDQKKIDHAKKTEPANRRNYKKGVVSKMKK